MTPRAVYRSRQFFTSLRPRIDASLRDSANVLLSNNERALFETMTLRDQQHCLDVYRRLREEHSDRDLLIAALLHDCGKGQIALWHRVAYVVLEASAPSLLRRNVTPGQGTRWREALYRCVHHAELGTALALGAGASERVAALIRGDASSGLQKQIDALQAADDA